MGLMLERIRKEESIATIHAALEAGITLLDTGDFYGVGHNELLIREALKGRNRDKVLLSVKFGALRGPDGSFLGYDGRPQAVKNFVAYSLKRLGTDNIDIYRPARVDPNVPIEETVGAIDDLIQAGYVRWLGLREAYAILDATLPANVLLKARLSSPGRYVQADGAHLTQIFTNLVSNAAEAMGGTGWRDLCIHSN